MVKLIVFGLDGATFDILNPIINNGILPNLKKIVENGVNGSLESTFCPATGPAWTSLATGKNPGKTGVFDFYNRYKKNSYEMRSMNSTDIRRQGAYWDIISDAGFNVGLLNYPMLYPPYPINGFMVSGLGSSPDENITYPRDLKQKLINVCNGYKIHIPFAHKKYTLNPMLFIKDINELLHINNKSIDFLMNYNPDIFTVVISATDFAQHFMWKYIDDTHPLYKKNKASKYKPLFINIWQKVDEIIGSTLDLLTENGNLIIVSDHGFGPHKQTFYVNNWLQKETYLFRQNLIRIYINKILSKLIKKIDLSIDIKFLKKFQRNSICPTNYLDMKRTKAFSNINSGGVGEIFINDPEKSLKNNNGNYETIKNIITEKLVCVCKKLNIKVNIYCPKEVYKGNYLHLVPDILFILNNIECEVSSKFKRTMVITTLSNTNHSGTHRKNGIFLAYGSDIEKGGNIIGAKIYDIAPTILYMFDLPIPKDIDGRVLKEIFSEDSDYVKKEIRYKKYEEHEMLKEKIRKLKLNGKF